MTSRMMELTKKPIIQLIERDKMLAGRKRLSLSHEQLKADKSVQLHPFWFNMRLYLFRGSPRYRGLLIELLGGEEK